jgi:hypothetical protein
VASHLDAHLETLAGLVRNTEVTDRSGRARTLDHAVDWMRKAARETHGAGNKNVFVGNGGSSSIASNDLRRTGDVNLNIRAHEYGFVEISHLSLCAAMLDLDMGWGLPP